MHFFSRSRQELWHKGATSGNTQAVKAIRYDCDGDALLALVEPAGPACHTGERTCFHRGELEPAAPHEVLPALERTIAARAAERPEGSYTAALLADPGRIGEKVQEEAEEVARAAREESDERVAEEAADLLYHLAVLLARPRACRCQTPSGCSMAVASAEAPAGVTPSLEEVRALAREHNLIPLRETFIDDCQTPVSAFLKLRERGSRVPARVGRAGPRGPLLVHRLSPAQACCAGRWETRAIRTRWPRPSCARFRAGAAAGPAAVRRRGGRACSPTTWCAPSSRSASRTRTRSESPTWP